MSEAEIICERHGAAGIVVLNRPKALNALTPGMVADLARALDAWEHDPAVSRVVLKAAGDRAFCAGGDIRMLYEAGRAGDLARSLGFWRDEYILNVRIKRYPKPYLSLIDGVVMGGGVGVSLHGSYRIAGDRYGFAMPEVGIGFFPDVGATYALPRLPGGTGMYLGLTGARVGPDDAVALGLATHRVASADLAGLEAALVAGEAVEDVLREVAKAIDEGPLLAERDVIDRCFSADSIPEILSALDGAASGGSAFAAETAATIRTKAPSSLAITVEQVRRGRTLSFEDAMATEFRVVSRVAEGHDFYEGVRAAIIDKDRAPRWRPGTIAEIDAAFVAAHFAPLGAAELFGAP